MIRKLVRMLEGTAREMSIGGIELIDAKWPFAKNIQSYWFVFILDRTQELLSRRIDDPGKIFKIGYVIIFEKHARHLVLFCVDPKEY